MFRKLVAYTNKPLPRPKPHKCSEEGGIKNMTNKRDRAVELLEDALAFAENHSSEPYRVIGYLVGSIRGAIEILKRVKRPYPSHGS